MEIGEWKYNFLNTFTDSVYTFDPFFSELQVFDGHCFSWSTKWKFVYGMQCKQTSTQQPKIIQQQYLKTL